jgi:hypothetical protein
MSDADLIPAWEDGQLRPLDKLDVHRRGLRHLAISVFVTDGDAVLLQRRALGKYHTPGCGRTPAAPIPIGANRPKTAPGAGWARSWGLSACCPNGGRGSNTAPMSAAG